MSSNNAFTSAGATPGMSVLPKPSSKLTVGGKTPIQNALDSVRSTVAPTTPGATSGIALAPGNRSLGGVFVPAKTITPDTSYIPVGTGELPSKPAVQPTVSQPQPTIKTTPYTQPGTPVMATSPGVIPSPGYIPQQTTVGTNPTTGARFDTQGNVITPGTAQTPNLYAGLIGSATTAANNNANLGQNAADIAKRFGQQIADVGQQGAKAQAGYLTTGTSPVGEGNAAIQAQSTAAQQSALAQGESAALLGTGQQITANQNQTTGLINTAGLAAPSLGQYGQTFYNPVTGAQGGNNDFAAALSSYATGLANGSMSPSQIPASITSNPVLYAQLLQQTQGINPNFNVAQSEANVAAQGQALTSANQTGGDIKKRGDTVVQHMQGLRDSLKNITSTNFPLVNLGLNTIRNLAPSPEYSAFITNIENVRGELAGIFGIGGTPTEGEAMAKAILPDTITPAQLDGALTKAQELINEKISSYSTPTPVQYNTGSQAQGGSGGQFDW